jgi:hypothetical protein
MLVPSFEEFPPRFVTLVTDTRKKLLPALARQLFAKGRDQFHADKKEDAARQFEQVLVLANDPVVRDAAEGVDLRTLASGYLDLLRAQAQPAPAVQAVATSAPALPSVRQPVRNAAVTQAIALRQPCPHGSADVDVRRGDERRGQGDDWKGWQGEARRRWSRRFTRPTIRKFSRQRATGSMTRRRSTGSLSNPNG